MLQLVLALLAIPVPVHALELLRIQQLPLLLLLPRKFKKKMVYSSLYLRCSPSHINIPCFHLLF